MNYSPKQKLFAEFMLHRIGMNNEKDVEIYLAHLEKLYGRWESYNRGESYYNPTGWRISVNRCVDELMQEIDLKKTKHETIKLLNTKDTISSSDLATFDFCPASFVISNSFQIDKPSGIEFTEEGKLLHEKLLAARIRWYETDGDNFSSPELNSAVIKESKLIFAGHSEVKKIFSNGIWNGTPDYIFQDKEGKYFVVEEKFHKKRDPAKLNGYQGYDRQVGEVFDEQAEKDADKERERWAHYKGYFFSNHIVQIASYLKNIKDYKIDYGYLLYWYYDKKDDIPYIHKALAKKIVLDTQTEELYLRSFEGIQALKTDKNIAFNTDKLNMRKCAGCVVNKYCGHKTRRYNTLPFTYSLNQLNLFFVTFPDELRKKPL